MYRVKFKEDKRLYAVKIAREMYKGSSDRVRKLEEVRKHQFLPPHSNLVRFYHSWEEKARLYQQFELCSSSLQDLGQEGRLSESLIWSYMVDLLLALQHLHDHDLVHMDIKPDNIFIGMDGICKLGDFGLMIDLAKGENDGELILQNYTGHLLTDCLLTQAWRETRCIWRRRFCPGHFPRLATYSVWASHCWSWPLTWTFLKAASCGTI